jgi:hypothetical protein
MVLSTLLFNINRIRGPQFFLEASKKSWFNIRFIYSYNRFTKTPERYPTAKKFFLSYSNFVNLPVGVRRRYGASLLGPDVSKFDSIDSIGCSNATCPTKRLLKDMAKQALSDPAGLDLISSEKRNMLAEWGHSVKFCSGCVTLSRSRSFPAYQTSHG